jgi:hypothetical protein
MSEQAPTYPKTAACACGALSVTATAAPHAVQACSCFDCQRGTGSAFSYSAFFAAADVTVAGPVTRWRRSSQSGRWQESSFCPTCGVTVFARLEVVPDLVVVSAGCFADSDFPGPAKFYWNSRRHHWLELPAAIATVDTQ